jgi:hypothetical protein
MPFFGPKHRPLTGVPDEWIVAEGEAPDGRPLLLRIRSAAWSIAGHPEYPIRVGLAAPIASTGELERVNDPASAHARLEDLAMDMLEHDLLAVMVVALTALEGQLFRELVFYAKDSPDLGDRLERICAESDGVEPAAYAERDPKWAFFLSTCGKNPPR